MTRFFKVPLLTTLFIFSLLSMLSTQIIAATMTVSDNLIVSEVNDKIVDNGFLGKKSLFELNQGDHVLIVRYKDVFEDLDFAEERLVESEDFVVKFTITDQKQLGLSTIEIKNLSGAEYFAKSPKLKLQDKHANQLIISLEKVADYKLAKQVDMAVSAFIPNKETQTPQITKAVTLKTEKRVNEHIQVNSLTMLKYWWQNASNDEKQRFKTFISEN